MSIDALSFDIPIDARELFEELRTELEMRISDLLFRGDYQSELLTFKLAWLGSSPSQRPLIEKEIAHLLRMPDGEIQPVGWKHFKKGCKSSWDKTCKLASKTCDSVKEFWDDHKKEILTGLAVAAVVAATATVIVYSGGTAAQSAIAIGAGAIDSLINSEKPNIPPLGPLTHPSSIALPENTSFLEASLDFSPPGIKTPINIDLLSSFLPPKEITQEDSEFEVPAWQNHPPLSILDPHSYHPFVPIEYRPPASSAPTESPPFLRPNTPADTRPELPFIFDPEQGPKGRWAPTKTSKNFEIPGPQLPHGRIGAIFGINTSQLENEMYAHSIRELADKHHVDCTYNATHSFFIDLLEASLLNYQGYSAPAKHLIEAWTKFDADYHNDPDAKYLQICHSQGAIHVKNALSQCPEHLRNRIIVLAIAPGEIVPTDLCFQSFNYASKRDIVPYGKPLVQAFFAPDNDEKNLENSKCLHELILLDPHPDAPVFDHSYNSPTFMQVKNDRIMEFLEKYGPKK